MDKAANTAGPLDKHGEASGWFIGRDGQIGKPNSRSVRMGKDERGTGTPANRNRRRAAEISSPA